MVLSSEKNLYEILEICSNASSGAIKTAYRRLVRKYHPDLNGNDHHCVRKFKEISEAYEILSDTEKKKNYDLLNGFYKETSQAKYTEANRAYKQTQRDEKQHKTSDSFSNILNDILGFKKTTSSNENQTYKSQKAKPERGSDVYTDVIISMSEAIQGTSRTLNILHTEICPNCEGRLFINGSKCPLCKGCGEDSTHKKLNVKIPPNVKHGSKIRIANEGNRGYNGGKNGDLYLNIKIESDSIFKYEGLNVLSTVAITPFEAALGATIEIPSPGGKIKMKITPNTSSGQKFRLSGEGLEQEDKKGDMIVTVNIEIPQKLSEEEIKLYKKLKDISTKNIREDK